jgi:hypothetical protein
VWLVPSRDRYPWAYLFVDFTRPLSGGSLLSVKKRYSQGLSRAVHSRLEALHNRPNLRSTNTGRHTPLFCGEENGDILAQGRWVNVNCGVSVAPPAPDLPLEHVRGSLPRPGRAIRLLPRISISNKLKVSSPPSSRPLTTVFPAPIINHHSSNPKEAPMDRHPYPFSAKPPPASPPATAATAAQRPEQKANTPRSTSRRGTWIEVCIPI